MRAAISSLHWKTTLGAGTNLKASGSSHLGRSSLATSGTFVGVDYDPELEIYMNQGLDDRSQVR